MELMKSDKPLFEDQQQQNENGGKRKNKNENENEKNQKGKSKRVRRWGPYELERKIGEGSFGKVYSSKDYALKKIVRVIQGEVPMKPSEFREMIDNEIKINRILADSEATVPMYDLENQVEDDYAWLVFKRMDGPLHKYEINNPCAISKKLIECVYKLHTLNVVHRDIKPQNILVSIHKRESIERKEKGPISLRLCDLGMARVLNADTISSTAKWTDYVTTRWYRAPEVLYGNYSPEQTKASDMWSVGCVIAGFYLNRPLFPGSSVLDQARLIGYALGLPGLVESWNPATTPMSKKMQTLIYESAKEAARAPRLYGEFKLAHLLRDVPSIPKDLITNLLTYSTKDRLSAREALRYFL